MAKRRIETGPRPQRTANRRASSPLSGQVRCFQAISRGSAQPVATGKAKAGIHDDSYFTLTQLVGSRLAALTAAPGAPPPDVNSDLKQLDDDMASVDQLRMSGKLEKLLPKAAANPANAIAQGANPPSQPTAAAAH